MSGGIFSALPIFAQGDTPTFGLMDLLRMQDPGQGSMGSALGQESAQDVPAATPPGFTGFQPQTPPTGAPTGVVQPGAMLAVGGLASALGPGSAQAGEMPAARGGGFTDRVATVESGGNNFAKNPRSSATGAGQFIDGTWLDQVRKNRPDLAGLPNNQILAMRSDPELSRQMIEAYGNENGAKLQSAGLPVNDGTKYLAHFAGPRGAISLLSADPSAPVGQVLQPGQISANPFLRNWTAGQVVNWAIQKMGGGGGGGSTPAPTPAIAAPASTSMGSTATRGGFGLGGVQAQGSPIAGQASPTPALPALAGQPTSLEPPPPQQGVGTYGAVREALQGLLPQGGQGQQRGGSGPSGLPMPAAGGGRVPSLQQARQALDPRSFFRMLQAHGIGR
ncbi:hypothetical protein Q8W71_29840 [Methylobacterium sp. NEAU 140]|uniref:hypothetical protein n=1 Tax=Methylobacterium sp. NEAU 140 TaxID=3064945 RepID=UPI00273590A9|nr:hypothetical protein [Methylobacterium sp. NEAU 140]MDP4026811.1 hypothetical protein [Methylobacterium sp. NEAU 140]